jgi:hypothetical protein
MNASAKFYTIINNNIDIELMLISFLRTEYETEYEFNCDRHSIRDAIVGVFDLQSNFAREIDEYSNYLAIRIYA